MLIGVDTPKGHAIKLYGWVRKTILAPFRDSEHAHGEICEALQHRIMGHITEEYYRKVCLLYQSILCLRGTSRW
jgi:hypothetical protein